MIAHAVTGVESGPAVLLLHGFLGSRHDWDFLVPRLAPKFRCVAVDLPGHGETPIEVAKNFDATTDALAGLLDTLRIDRCAVVGYSMGGRVALGLAAAYSERVERLALESASPGMRTEEERAARREHDEGLARQLETVPFEDFLTRWYEQPLFETLKNHPAAFASVMERRRRNDPAGLAGSLRAIGVGSQPSLWEAWARLWVPVLTVVGDRDLKFQSIASEMQALLPHSRLRVVHGCGHNVHDENPEAYTKAVIEFLEG